MIVAAIIGRLLDLRCLPLQWPEQAKGTFECHFEGGAVDFLMTSLVGNISRRGGLSVSLVASSASFTADRATSTNGWAMLDSGGVSI